ncbi:MAG: hypothetical protein L7F77_12815 [Candidatus Magnetominusculus sp. LBB02]|nr:hypothetical protein [Candidatus Magnetominusculus sp. LBB02]
MRRLRQLLIYSACVCVISCAAAIKENEPPDNEVLTLPVLMERLGRVSEIKGSAAVDFKGLDGGMSGDAAVRVWRDGFDVKIYAMGFPAGELKLKDGVFESSPKLKEEDEPAIARCIKDGLFWWTSDDIQSAGDDGKIYLKSPGQIIVLDNSTLKPIEQAIALQKGEGLYINYKDSKKINGIWVPVKFEATSERYHLIIEFDKVELIMKTP